MRWRVLHLGYACFDALHAYGIAIVLATLTKQPVTMRYAGTSYELTSPAQTLPTATPELLDVLCPLPPEEQLQSPSEEDLQDLPITILDGLLAALLTNPRAPLKASIHELRFTQRFQPSIIAQGLIKVRNRIETWKDWIQRTAQDATNWVAEMLDDYTWQAPVAPVLFAGHSKHDLRAPMTLDPSFAYSFHLSLNTRDMTNKSNVAIRGTRYATLLAFLGAARFLRAQAVAQPYLVFSVPIVEHGVIETWTALPCLPPDLATSPDRAVVRQWLAHFLAPVTPAMHWRSLTYVTFQQQKRHQPLCTESGSLSFAWLRQLEQRTGNSMLAFWQSCLAYGSPEEREPLAAFLKQQRGEEWYRHLLQRTNTVLTSASPCHLRLYRVEEVRECIAMTDSSASHPLRAVLECKTEGTVRFGHALRLLGGVRPDLRRDLLELLEPVRTEEELLFVLRHIVDACADAKLKQRYLLVPTDDDFPPLLDDIHQHGLRPIVGVLLVLSALQYPPTEDLRKYELGTVIRALFVLARALSAPVISQEPSDGSALPVEQIMGDESLMFSQEEPDDSAS